MLCNISLVLLETLLDCLVAASNVNTIFAFNTNHVVKF